MKLKIRRTTLIDIDDDLKQGHSAWGDTVLESMETSTGTGYHPMLLM